MKINSSDDECSTVMRSVFEGGAGVESGGRLERSSESDEGGLEGLEVRDIGGDCLSNVEEESEAMLL